jgi:Cysteine dioxygenase type I
MTMATETKDAAPALKGWLDETLIAASPSTLEELEAIVTDVGRSPWLWGHAVSFDLERRSHRVLYKAPHLDIALFGWAAGQDTVFHDHGGASGAAFVCSGALIEDTVEAVDGQVVVQRTHTRAAESAFNFGPDYIHRVRTPPRPRHRALDSCVHPGGIGPNRLRGAAGRDASRNRGGH